MFRAIKMIMIGPSKTPYRRNFENTLAAAIKVVVGSKGVRPRLLSRLSKR
jgi:hypothetical protein